jgi:hypothetical protein
MLALPGRFESDSQEIASFAGLRMRMDGLPGRWHVRGWATFGGRRMCRVPDQTQGVPVAVGGKDDQRGGCAELAGLSVGGHAIADAKVGGRECRRCIP